MSMTPRAAWPSTTNWSDRRSSSALRAASGVASGWPRLPIWERRSPATSGRFPTCSSGRGALIACTRHARRCGRRRLLPAQRRRRDRPRAPIARGGDRERPRSRRRAQQAAARSALHPAEHLLLRRSDGAVRTTRQGTRATGATSTRAAGHRRPDVRRSGACGRGDVRAA